MRTTDTNATEEVLDYIETLPDFSKKICKRLRKIILDAVPNIIEDWKLSPNYTWLGEVCSFCCFQKHVKLIFFNGSAMTDSNHLFKHYAAGQMGRAHQFIRFIRYTNENELDAKVLRKYIQESAMINEAGFKNRIMTNEVTVSDKMRRILLKA